MDFTPVDAPPSAIKLAEGELTDQDRKDITEVIAASVANPAKRFVASYATSGERDKARLKIRTIAAEHKPKMTASVWDASDEDADPPVFALSVSFTKWVKKAKKASEPAE